MIEKHIAVEIIRATLKYKLQGRAFSFGDQKPTFTKAFAEHAIAGIKNKEENPGEGTWEDAAMSESTFSSAEFFSLLGYTDFVDIDYNGSARLTLDLGQPLDPELHGQAALLFDGGTIEHIPDIYQAVSNAALLVKKGGVLLQATPLNSLGDSYYCIDPMFYRDFYSLNGFEMLNCYCYHRSKEYYRHPFTLARVCAKLVREYKRLITPKEQFARIQSDFYNKHGWKPVDSLETIVKHDPWDRKFHQDIQRNGMPWWMHVLFIGIKRQDLKPEQIKAPCQGNYPSAIVS